MEWQSDDMYYVLNRYIQKTSPIVTNLFSHRKVFDSIKNMYELHRIPLISELTNSKPFSIRQLYLFNLCKHNAQI